MRKKLAGGFLAAALLLGAAPLTGAAQAADDTTDPVLCFVASQAIITEALHEYHEGHLTARELRSVLVGTASFLGDCLTPTEPSVQIPTPPTPSVPTLPSVPGFPPIHIHIPTIPSFPRV